MTPNSRGSPASGPPVRPSIAAIALGVLTLIVAIFLGYEAVERAWLGDLDMETLHRLHILRGVGTATVAAAFVYICLRRGVADPLFRGGRIVTEEPGRRLDVAASEAARHGRWLIQLRWLASVVAFGVVSISTIGLDLLPPRVRIPLFASAACIPLANVLLQFAYRRGWNPYRLLVGQIVLDLLLLTVMLHFSGGLENSVFYFYVFHVIIAGIILRPGQCFAVTALAAALFAGVGLLEMAELVPHYTFSLFPHHGTHSAHSPTFVLGVTIPFSITLFVTAFFASSIMESLRARQRDLARTTRLAAMGELAGGVAHEINNPVGIISGKVRLLLEKHPDGSLPPKVFHDLTVIQRNLERVERISRSLLNFCRPSPGAPRRTDLNRVVRENLQLVESRLSSARILVRTVLDPELPVVHADPSDLGQILLNLINNAADAMPQGGRLLVRTRRQDGSVRIDVGDTGPGIPPDVRERIFDPLFTTKPPGKGTGLGLAVSREIAGRYGGTIEFETSRNDGTTFSVMIPTREGS